MIVSWLSPTQTLWQGVSGFPESQFFLIVQSNSVSNHRTPLKMATGYIALWEIRSNKMSSFFNTILPHKSRHCHSKSPHSVEDLQEVRTCLIARSASLSPGPPGLTCTGAANCFLNYCHFSLSPCFSAVLSFLCGFTYSSSLQNIVSPLVPWLFSFTESNRGSF
jgi:hypothetical protein